MNDFKKMQAPQKPRPFVIAHEENVLSHLGEKGPSPSGHTQKIKRYWLRLLFFLFLLSLMVLGTLAILTYRGLILGESIRFENQEPTSFLISLKNFSHGLFSSKVPLRKTPEGRINILLLGRAGEQYPGKNLTDTVIILSIDTAQKRVALLSLPRDLYVPIGNTDLYTKLNSVFQYGLSQNEGLAPLKTTIEAITGQPVHYFITVDFDGFEKIVDSLGGITLDVPRDFYDPRYPGKNYSYETFELNKGWQTLDGATALKYVRERHDDPAGDFGRAKRQQQVIQAIKEKTFSLGTLFNIVTLDHLMTTLGESVKTDMTLEEMGQFLDLSRALDTQNITTVVVDAWKKESLLRVSHIQVGPVAAFILVPRIGNWSEIHDISNTIFQREEQTRRKNAILAENASVTLYLPSNESDIRQRLGEILKEELGFSLVESVSLGNFPNRPERSILVERERLSKPFSLDILLKKFSPEQSVLPFVPTREPVTDYSLVVGTDLAQTLSLVEGDELLHTSEDASFSEPLPPQPLKQLH